MTAAIYDPYWDTLGGGERYCASLASLLSKLGWQVDIIWPTDISNKIQSRFNIDISRAHFIHELQTTNYQLLFWLSDGSLPISLARKTIIHFQFPFQNIGGRSFINRSKSKFYKFVANSFFTKSFVDHEFAVDCQVIYPPVNTDYFTPFHPKTKSIIYAGRFSLLTQAKGQHYLIKAFSQLYQMHPDWQLVLIGGVEVGTEGKFLHHLQDLSHGLPVQIITSPTLALLKHHLSQAQIFWSASGYGIDQSNQPLRVEHFGITVVEAMAAGCVPLITNLGGHPEIVTPGSDGYLYDTLDQLVNQTHDLIKNPKQLAVLSQAAVQKSKIFSTRIFEDNFTKLLV